MDDIDRLQRKFDALYQAVDANVSAAEREYADRLAREPSAEEIRAELQLHEDALGIAAERQRDLDSRWDRALDARDHAELERLEAVRAELIREMPLLRDAIADLRGRLEAPPTTTG